MDGPDIDIQSGKDYSLHKTVNQARFHFKVSFFNNRKINIKRDLNDDHNLFSICKNIDAYFKYPGKKDLKDDQSSTVIKIETGQAEFVARRDNFVHTIKFLSRIFRKSRSRKVWKNAQLVNHFNLNTVKPLALIEDYWFFVRINSYVVYEYINGTTLKDFFSDPTIADSEKEKTAAQVVQTINSWHAFGISHGDPKASNVLIKENDIYLIDAEDIKTPRTVWLKRHAIARDQYIILHNMQKHQFLRDIWVRRFLLDCDFGLHYFSKQLVKKFWKDEYAILSLAYSKRIDTFKIIEKIFRSEPLENWVRVYASKRNVSLLSNNDSAFCVVTPGAFYFAKSLRGYFKKKRVPQKGILCMTVALRICGFNLPEIINGGIFEGYEYVFFGQKEEESIYCVWEKVENDPFEKQRLLKELAEEIGRLHALGFVGALSSMDNLFIKKRVNGLFAVGFKPTGNVRWYQGKGLKHSIKEIEMFKKEFLLQLPSIDANLFLSKYNEVLRKA